MIRRKQILRTLVAVTCLSLVANSGFFAPMRAQAAKDDELPEAITLPIALLDFNADNLLFQYDLDDAGDFALTGDMFTKKEGFNRVPLGYEDYLYFMQGLVEKDLDDETYTPVYRQETVELVARMVVAQMTKPSVRHDTQRFKALRSKLVDSYSQGEDATDITHAYNVPLNIMFFTTEEEGNAIGWKGDNIGWKIEGITGYTIDDRSVKDGEAVIWRHEWGIQHQGTDTHVLTKTITDLDPNVTYTLTAGFENSGLSLSLMDESGDYAERTISLSLSEDGVDHGNTGGQVERTITFNGRESITLKIEASGDKCYLNYLYLDQAGRARRTVVSNQPSGVFTDSGWKPENGSNLVLGIAVYEDRHDNYPALLDESGNPQWWLEDDGLVNGGDNSSVYKELTLTPGQIYIVSDSRNPDMHVEIQDQNGKSLVENMVNGSMFTAPSNDGKIKIAVKGTGDGGSTPIWPNRKLAVLNLLATTATLGTYEDTVKFFEDGTKGYNEIRNCMDYAYYVLNNFWIEQDDLSYRSNDFHSITLKALDDKGNYGFFADVSGVSEHAHEKVFYDRENHNIRNDEKGKQGGLFPLDWADSWGVDKRPDYTDDIDTGGNMRNFHYSLYSHATFIYEEDANLYFDFVGDDDVYLFINGQLAMDIGGAHLAAHDHIEINQLIKDGVLDKLDEGRAYTFDFFYMERHTDFSNLAIQTNIQLLEDGTLDLNFYDENGNQLKKGDTVKSGSRVEMEYEFHVNVDGVTDVNFEDKGLGIVIGIGGLKYGNNISLKNGKITVIIEEADQEPVERTFGNEEELKKFFDEAIFYKNTVVRVRGLMYTVDIEKGDLQANVSVSFKSPNYAGAVDKTSNETAFDLGHLTVVGASGSQNPQSPAPGQNSPADTSASASESTTKSPATDDRAPIGLSLALLLFGFALVGASAYLKKQEQRHTA